MAIREMNNKMYTDRDYFDEKFTNINGKFGEVISRLDNLNKSRIPKIEERLECIELTHKVDDEVQKRWWVKYKRTLETIAVIIAFLTLFYMNWSDKHLIKQVKQKAETTNQILVPEAVRRGFSLDSLGLNE